MSFFASEHEILFEPRFFLCYSLSQNTWKFISWMSPCKGFQASFFKMWVLFHNVYAAEREWEGHYSSPLTQQNSGNRSRPLWTCGQTGLRVWQCELHLILVVTCRPSHPLRVLCAWFQDASRKKLAHGVFLDKISGNSNKDEKMRGNEMVTVNMGSVVASHVSVVEVLCSHVLTLRELAAQN